MTRPVSSKIGETVTDTATVLADPRLAGVAALRAPRLLDVPEPRLVVLQEAARRARAVPILIDDKANT